MGDREGKLDHGQPTSGSRPLGAQSRLAPVLGTLGDPPAQSAHTQPGHLRHPPSLARMAGLIFRGVGQW